MEAGLQPFGSNPALFHWRALKPAINTWLLQSILNYRKRIISNFSPSSRHATVFSFA